MSAQLTLWLTGGAITLLLMMLTVVIIARGMDGAKPVGQATPAKAGESEDATGAAIKQLLGGHVGGKVAQALKQTEAKQGKTSTASKGVGGLVGIAGAIFAAGVSVAVAIGNRDEHSPPTPVEIAAGDLHGVLLSPRKNAPVVLIVPGSGPTDRDGNNPLGVKANGYKLLAEGLAEKGIATVRVDKRGMFASAPAGDPNAVTVEKYAEDYRAWIDAIREQTGRKCVWLLGHSEGALMVSAAAEGRKDVCGLILVAGMGRKLGDVLRSQLQDNPANAPLLDQAFAAIADLEAGRRTDTSAMHPALVPLFAPAVQDFLISEMAIDPVEAVRRARVKALIVQGTADLQTTLEDARLLDKAPRTTLRTITGMNHILKEAAGDRIANLATYSDPDLPLAPRLVRVIEDFIEDDD
jgi:pimeloyl-ACP methyl ester carboxylesterase